ncbi:MAG: type II toxin-antitoxin system RelE/ParE family toxin [Candidatus Bathyarchaeota archaeon]|nr:type II toxin-antitoxin system RelE/ParE family toxin [Candidatus Bathyarchaeota archaeon A05DMB-5]MDH7557203.1 type II toxin-antitoxin system RelE/ParE family toxin [Candidatus Bathyarchaeota archaeon]
MKTKFEIRFTPRFLKKIKAFDRGVQVRMLRGISILKTDPFAGKPLRGEWKGVYSLRIGDYRVLYQIKKNEVFLLVVGHRKRVY